MVDKKDWDQVEAMLWSRRLLREIPHVDLRDHGRYLAVPGQEFTPNVGLTFVGHSVVENPRLFRSHLFVDTGMGTIPDGRLTLLASEMYELMQERTTSSSVVWLSASFI